MLLITIAVAVVLWCVYILPAIVAIRRRHPEWVSILIINICLGWTLVAWVICLAWACQRLHTWKIEDVPPHMRGQPNGYSRTEEYRWPVSHPGYGSAEDE